MNEQRAPWPHLRWGAPLFVLLATVLAFLPGLGGEFVSWDDDQNFVNNPYWRGLSTENLRWMFSTRWMGPYQPLSWVSLGLDYELWGDGPFGPHLGNLIYHALAAWIFYFVARRLFARAAGTVVRNSPNRWSGACAALFFALHPLRVESVSWATERRDCLSGMFLALTLLLYLHAVERGNRLKPWHYAGALIAFGLSLLSKASGMTLPLVLVLIDAWPLKRVSSKTVTRVVLEKLPFFALAAAAAWVALEGQAEVGAFLSAEDLPFFARLKIATFAVVFYVVKSLWPLALWPHYTIPLDLDFGGARFWIPLVLVGSISVLTLIFAKRRPSWAVGWWSYLLLLAPVSGLAQAGRQLVADRYSYLPGMIFGLTFGSLVLVLSFRLNSVRRTAAIAVLVLASLMARTIEQTGVWKSSESLWTQVLMHQPDSVPARNNLASLLAERDEDAAALEHFEQAARLAPAEPSISFNLARHYDKLGRGEDALREAERAAQLDPSVWQVHFFLGTRRLAVGQPALAALDLERAHQLQPGFVPITTQRVRALGRQGRGGEAEAMVRLVLSQGLGTTAQRARLAEVCEEVGLEPLALELRRKTP